VDAAEAVDDDEWDEEGGKLSGGKMIPELAFLPPYASSSASADEVELEEELGHCPCPCPDPEAVPGRDPVPTMAYCSSPRPALEDGLLPAETADEPLRPRPMLIPDEEEGRRPLGY
jgi:hypothetical protein